MKICLINYIEKSEMEKDTLELKFQLYDKKKA